MKPPAFISLDRRAIVGRIDAETPRVVLIDVLDSHGFKYSASSLDNQNYREKLLSKLSLDKVSTVPATLFEQDFDAALVHEYRRAATFVNKEHSWPYSKLATAYNWLLLFYRDSPTTVLSPLSMPFEVGPQTPDQPYRINASVLYGYCRQYGIRTGYDTLLEEMATAVRLFQEGRTSLLAQLNNNLDRLSLPALVNLMIYLNRHPDDDNNKVIIRQRIRRSEVRVQALIRKSSRLDDDNVIAEIRSKAIILSKTMNKSIDVNDDIDAIVMAALNSNLDLSETLDPLEEYRRLQAGNYQPKDSQLQKRIESKFKDLDSPYLDQRFNAKLPAELYKMTTLEKLAKAAGYTYREMQLRSLHELLLEAALLNNFYHGRHSLARNSYSVVDDTDLNEYHFHQCVSYGLGQDFYVYTYDELARCFNINNNFQDPASTLGVQFSDLAVNKLSLLASRAKYADESADDYSSRQCLHRCILQVRKYLENKFTEYNVFMDRYQRENAGTKSQIVNIVQELHRLAMYMRGWNGQSELPIRRAPIDDQVQIDLRVSTQFTVFDQAALKYTSLLELPLLKYEAGKFVAATDKEYGLTIRERLSIIKSDGNNTNSCIRLSSKWLAGTSYYLMELLGLTPPYRIERLVDIS